MTELVVVETTGTAVISEVTETAVVVETTETVVIVESSPPQIVEVVAPGPAGPKGDKGDVGDVNPQMDVLLAEAETARDAAITAKNTAVTKAGEASVSASAAADSEYFANAYKNAAQHSADTATAAANSVGGSVSAVQGYSESASSSATLAYGYMTSAQTSAATATTKQGQAASSASAAALSATNAEGSATSAATSATSSSTSATNASTSAAAAADSEYFANEHKNAAQQSAATATAAASSAGGSVTQVMSYSESASSSATLAYNSMLSAQTSATLATTRRDQAATSASAAASSATSAAASATAAASSASAASSGGVRFDTFQSLTSGEKLTARTNIGLATVASSGDYADLTGKPTIPSSTSQIAEGSGLYFTAQRVRDAVLTGLSTVTNAVITATDTVLTALGKLQKQISDNLTTLTSHTGNASNPHSTTAAQVGAPTTGGTGATGTWGISISGNSATASDASKLGGQLPAYYLPAASYTAADVLAKTKTVDGAGSGLDADLLDGLDSLDFARGNVNLTKAQLDNGLLADGIYRNNGDGLTGGPDGWWHVIQMYHEVSGYAAQIAVELHASDGTGNNAARMLLRCQDGTSWSSWAPIKTMRSRNGGGSASTPVYANVGDSLVMGAGNDVYLPSNPFPGEEVSILCYTAFTIKGNGKKIRGVVGEVDEVYVQYGLITVTLRFSESGGHWVIV